MLPWAAAIEAGLRALAMVGRVITASVAVAGSGWCLPSTVVMAPAAITLL